MFYEYELTHPMDADYFKFLPDPDKKFPLHLHHCYEITIVTEGEIEITVDDTVYLLKKGEGVFIFPNQIHSTNASEKGSAKTVIFASNLIRAYTKTVDMLKPCDNRFTVPDSLMHMLGETTEESDIIWMKGFLYSLCSAFHKNATYKDAFGGSYSLLYQIFKFVEQNYSGDCSLISLSKEAGYEYTYISRYFKRNIGITYNEYVNQYRISRACYYLTGYDMSILQIATECGFNSLRSLNRNFKKSLGISPSEYRRQKLDYDIAT